MERRHVERAAQADASTRYVARLGRSTVAVVGRYAGQSRGGLNTDSSPFGQFGQDRCGGDRAYAGNGVEPISFVLEEWISGDELRDGRVALLDLLFEQAAQLARLPHAE